MYIDECTQQSMKYIRQKGRRRLSQFAKNIMAQLAYGGKA